MELTPQKADVSKISPEQIFKFIQLYTALEELKMTDAIRFFRTVFKDTPKKHVTGHLLDQWRYKEKRFGAFWLNLDTHCQILILNYWNLHVEGGEAYLKVVHERPVSALFAAMPPLVQALHDVVMYFENHSVEDHLEDGIILPAPAAKGREYGNATNWGAYFLSLGHRLNYAGHTLLKDIRDFYSKNNS